MISLISLAFGEDTRTGGVKRPAKVGLEPGALGIFRRKRAYMIAPVKVMALRRVDEGPTGEIAGLKVILPLEVTPSQLFYRTKDRLNDTAT